MRTLYLTSTILSMIWTLGDFNSVYLLTGGGPADLTHVLATLGIRYLRLDQVDLSMAAIVVRAAAGAAAGLLHDEAAVAMKTHDLAHGHHRGEAAADRHPGAASGRCCRSTTCSCSRSRRRTRRSPASSGPTIRRCTTSTSCSGEQHHYLNHFWLQLWNSLLIAVAVGALTLFVATSAAFAISRLQGARRPHGDEPGALHLLHPGRVPRRADVQDDGHLRPAQQPVGADPGDGDDRLAVFDLGAEAGVRQAALRARRGGAASTARRRCSCSASSTCR